MSHLRISIAQLAYRSECSVINLGYPLSPQDAKLKLFEHRDQTCGGGRIEHGQL